MTLQSNYISIPYIRELCLSGQKEIHKKHLLYAYPICGMCRSNIFDHAMNFSDVEHIVFIVYNSLYHYK
jgi:hypothetical protein